LLFAKELTIEMFIDTHAHLYLDEFKKDIDEIITRAVEQDVRKIYLPNIDITSIEGVLELERKFPEHCFAMMGLHPCYVKEDYKEQLAAIELQFENHTFKAVGEIGIDLYWDKSFQSQQEEAFRLQIEWAKQKNLPIVIHSRDSLDLTLSIVEECQDGNLKGIFHCFNGTIEQSLRIKDLNFLVGLRGVITYKNAGLDEMIRQLDRQMIVLETDAPYLSPVPYRGKRNESSYIFTIAEKLAWIRDESLSEIKEYTTNNAQLLFG
jgi:TatD DNase family protein